MTSRDDLVSQYLDLLPFEPYPVQEEALLAWFSTDDGILVCAPTGTGKTLIAEAALFEALHTGRTAYYTTPLIALTDQKFQEVQDAAVRWGFKAEDVGLVTGNRKVNPDAKVLVVVAEILLNRLLNKEAFDFADVSAVVMDEFHSFNDPERGIVWELSLSLLPKTVRLLLLSATVGNTNPFLIWLNRSHGRKLELVQGTVRKVPLAYHWIEDELLTDQLTRMASGDEDTRHTPTLLFCFNREECWTVADQLRGKNLLAEGQQKRLAEEIKQLDWSQGIGPKLKTILLRGVGVHHAGLLPKYKRVVEDLFQQKLLSVCVCTETLAAGMNLPARSVVITALLKGPPGKKRPIDPSSGHQMFGRAGRPQFDTEGHVYALAHEDDVKIARYKEKMATIPEDTKDPLLLKKLKQLKKKMPKRRTTVQYWNESHFTQLIEAPPNNLVSQGQIPWRLLAYLLSNSPNIRLVRTTISKRLMDSKAIDTAQQGLVRMLLTLELAGFVTLKPAPTPQDRTLLRPHSADAGMETLAPVAEFYAKLKGLSDDGAFSDAGSTVIAAEEVAEDTSDEETADEDFGSFGVGVDGEPNSTETKSDTAADSKPTPATAPESTESKALNTTFGLGIPSAEKSTPEPAVSEPETPEPKPAEPAEAEPPKPKRLSTSLKALLQAQGVQISNDGSAKIDPSKPRLIMGDEPPERIDYAPVQAFQTEQLDDLLMFRSINPIYATFLAKVLPYANQAERIQGLEAALQFPGSLVRNLRIPKSDMQPSSQFTNSFVHPQLLTRGLATPTELGDLPDDWAELPPEERVWPLTFPDKLLKLFRAEFPGVDSIGITPVWAAGELLAFGGDFNKLVTSRNLTKQEGIVFRHVLRFVLLCAEFIAYLPLDSEWGIELSVIADELTESCRAVDPRTTDQMVESANEPDPLLAK